MFTENIVDLIKNWLMLIGFISQIQKVLTSRRISDSAHERSNRSPVLLGRRGLPLNGWLEWLRVGRSGYIRLVGLASWSFVSLMWVG